MEITIPRTPQSEAGSAPSVFRSWKRSRTRLALSNRAAGEVVVFLLFGSGKDTEGGSW